ncbi:unnamed protein product [Prunus armeniaca]
MPKLATKSKLLTVWKHKSIRSLTLCLGPEALFIKSIGAHLALSFDVGLVGVSLMVDMYPNMPWREVRGGIQEHVPIEERGESVVYVNVGLVGVSLMVDMCACRSA